MWCLNGPHGKNILNAVSEFPDTLSFMLSSLKGFGESSQKWVKSTYPINLLKFNRTGGFTSYRLLTLAGGKAHLNCIFVVYYMYWAFFRCIVCWDFIETGTRTNFLGIFSEGHPRKLTLNIFHGNSKGAAFKIPCFFNILFITCFALVSPLFTKYFIFWVPDGKTCIYLYI